MGLEVRWHGRGMEVAVVTLLHFLYQHLEDPKTQARLLVIDSSLAFNTIRPFLLAERPICHFKPFLFYPDSLDNWLFN